VNARYPRIVLRFEDGHEIRVDKGQGKTFDAYVGETVKVIAIWDPTADEREVVAVLKAEQFEEDT
jgi:hypothetical protein